MALPTIEITRGGLCIGLEYTPYPASMEVQFFKESERVQGEFSHSYLPNTVLCFRRTLVTSSVYKPLRVKRPGGKMRGYVARGTIIAFESATITRARETKAGRF